MRIIILFMAYTCMVHPSVLMLLDSNLQRMDSLLSITKKRGTRIIYKVRCGTGRRLVPTSKARSPPNTGLTFFCRII